MKLMHMGARMRHMIDVDPLLGKKRLVIVDGGASRGEFLNTFQAMMSHDVGFKSGMVYCFEPSRINKKYIPILSGAKIIQKALAGKSGKRVLTDFIGPKGKFHQWPNLYKNNIDTLKGRAQYLEYSVDAVGINELHKEIGEDHIDYLKLDIEGAEYEVFRQMKQRTAKKIGQFSVEVHSQKAREMVLRQAKRWKYNFIAQYANEIYFTEQPRE